MDAAIKPIRRAADKCLWPPRDEDDFDDDNDGVTEALGYYIGRNMGRNLFAATLLFLVMRSEHDVVHAVNKLPPKSPDWRNHHAYCANLLGLEVLAEYRHQTKSTRNPTGREFVDYLQRRLLVLQQKARRYAGNSE